MRRSRPINRASRRRKSTWAFFSDQGVGQSISEDLLANFRSEMGITAMLPGTTAGPIIGGLFTAAGDAGSSANNRAMAGIRRTDTSISPIGSADGPLDEPLSDWMWMVMGVNSVAAPNYVWTDPRTGNVSNAIAIHSRSKRKLDEPNSTLSLLADFAIDDGAAAATWSLWVRILITLP